VASCGVTVATQQQEGESLEERLARLQLEDDLRQRLKETGTCFHSLVSCSYESDNCPRTGWVAVKLHSNQPTSNWRKINELTELIDSHLTFFQSALSAPVWTRNTRKSNT
jgi:hypothetical protein